MNIVNNELDGWPLLHNISNNLSPLELMIRLNKRDFQPFISISLEIDLQNTSSYIIQVNCYCSPLIFLNLKDKKNLNSYKSKISRPSSILTQPLLNFSKAYNEAYRAYFLTIIKYLNGSNSSHEQAILDMLNLDSILSEIIRVNVFLK
jgi:hypothetical protein